MATPTAGNQLYIVRVECRSEYAGSIASPYVPVCASSEDEASKRAVEWHGDSCKAHQGCDLIWLVSDRERDLEFRAT